MGIKSWNKQPLKNLCSRVGDGLHGTPTYEENGSVYFINGNNLKSGKIEISEDTKKVSESEFEKNYIELDQNTLLLSINGTLGSMAFYKGEKVMLGKSAAYLNFNTEINRFYYYYFQLKGVQEYFYNVATGSTIKNLGLKSIQEFEVPVPEETEWKRIAKILSDLDAKIELNNKINAELEAMAKLIYDYWFVQYDFPDENGKPYKSSGGKMVYNEELKREVPEGWETKKIEEFVKLGSGYSFKSEDYLQEGNYKVITIKNVQDGFMDISKTDFLNEPPCELPEYCYLHIGDILMSLTGNVGRMCRVFDNNCLLNQRVGKMIGNSNYFNFIYLLLSRPEERLNLEKIATGSSQKNLSPINAMKRLFANPPDRVLNEFNAQVKYLFEKAIHNEVENKTLSELRDWLLPMLMNGQVKVN